MPRLRITVLDLVTKGPTRKLFARVMNPNFASIMPQAIAVWCEQRGHHVRYICYTGFEDLTQELLGEADVAFIGAFTQSAHAALCDQRPLSTALPPFFEGRIRKNLGPLWEALPPGGLMHDPNAYLHGSRASA